jgi:hypothetical protein
MTKIIEAILDLFLFRHITWMERRLQIAFGICAWAEIILIFYVIIF